MTRSEAPSLKTRCLLFETTEIVVDLELISYIINTLSSLEIPFFAVAQECQEYVMSTIYMKLMKRSMHHNSDFDDE